MKRAPVGWQSLGAIGGLLNIALYLPCALRERGGEGPVIALLATAGFLGVLVAPWRPVPGGFLVFAGICPNLLALPVMLSTLPPVLVAAWSLLPAAMMVVAAWKVSGCETSGKPDDVVSIEVRFRCPGCGVTFTPYPNASHRAGFCSRKCLLSAR